MVALEPVAHHRLQNIVGAAEPDLSGRCYYFGKGTPLGLGISC